MAATTLDDVFRELVALRAQVEARAIPNAAPIFGPFATDWLARQSASGKLRPNTISTYEQQLRVYLMPSFGELPMNEITTALVDTFVARMATTGCSPASVNVRVSLLCSILETAVEYDLILRNPAQGKNRRLREPVPRRSLIDRAEHIEALLAAASATGRGAGGRHRAMIATLIFAGLRISEALALRWEDIDLDRGTLEVRQAKSDAGVRCVEILPVLRDELGDWAARPASRSTDREALVFGTIRRGGPDTRQWVHRRLRGVVATEANRMLAAAGVEPLPKGLSPHSLRRAYASILFALGRSAPYVQEQIGHASAELTLTVYARPMPRGDAEALAALVAGRETAPAAKGGNA